MKTNSLTKRKEIEERVTVFYSLFLKSPFLYNGVIHPKSTINRSLPNPPLPGHFYLFKLTTHNSNLSLLSLSKRSNFLLFLKEKKILREGEVWYIYQEDYCFFLEIKMGKNDQQPVQSVLHLLRKQSPLSLKQVCNKKENQTKPIS